MYIGVCYLGLKIFYLRLREAFLGGVLITEAWEAFFANIISRARNVHLCTLIHSRAF